MPFWHQKKKQEKTFNEDILSALFMQAKCISPEHPSCPLCQAEVAERERKSNNLLAHEQNQHIRSTHRQPKQCIWGLNDKAF